MSCFTCLTFTAYNDEKTNHQKRANEGTQIQMKGEAYYTNSMRIAKTTKEAAGMSPYSSLHSKAIYLLEVTLSVHRSNTEVPMWLDETLSIKITSGHLFSSIFWP